MVKPIEISPGNRLKWCWQKPHIPCCKWSGKRTPSQPAIYNGHNLNPFDRPSNWAGWKEWCSQRRVKAKTCFYCTVLEIFKWQLEISMGASQVAQNPPATPETWVWSLGWEDALEKEGHGNPLQYSCLENPVDRGAWQATVHKVTKSQTWLKQLSIYACRGIFYLRNVIKYFKRNGMICSKWTDC